MVDAKIKDVRRWPSPQKGKEWQWSVNAHTGSLDLIA